MKYKMANVTQQATNISRMNDLKLNLYGFFLVCSSTAFSCDLIYTFSLLYICFYFFSLVVGITVLKLLRLTGSVANSSFADGLLLDLDMEACDYFLRLIFIISSMTWLCCLEDSLSRNFIYISLKLDSSETNLFFSLFCIRSCIDIYQIL